MTIKSNKIGRSRPNIVIMLKNRSHRNEGGEACGKFFEGRKKSGRDFRRALRSYLQHSRYYSAPCLIPLTAVSFSIVLILRPEVVPLVILTRHHILFWLSSPSWRCPLLRPEVFHLSSWLVNVLFTLPYPTVSLHNPCLINHPSSPTSHPEILHPVVNSCSVPSVPSDTINITLCTIKNLHP